MNDQSFLKSPGARIRSSRFSQTRLDTSSGSGTSQAVLTESFHAAVASPRLQAIDRCRFFDNRDGGNQKGLANTR